MATSQHVHDHDSGEGLLSVEEARERVLARIKPLQPLELPLTEAYGCVLAAGVNAERDIPDFASSAMDGFAVRSSEVADATPAAPVQLRVVGKAVIGERPEGTVGGGEAFRIATGAPVPAGADTVVPVENTQAHGDTVRVLTGTPAGKHVRPSGEDVRAGEPLVQGGRRLQAPELALLATAGFSHPLVHPRPRVVVLSTGDELVPPTRSPEYGQVRDANAYTLFGALREAGAVPMLAGIVRDDVESFREAVLSHLQQADAFISSGGVSVGERDVVKAAFLRRGDVEFTRVAMQPGMPQGFGEIEGTPFFGLPGNPVSVFVSFEVFVRPALMKMMGRGQLFRPEVPARLEEDVTGPAGKTQFARVRVRRAKDGWSATPTGGRGSNLIATVARANGLAIVPAGVETARAGSRVNVMLFRSMDE
ncbi:MAG TPA: gephyrin-like molybdotransferase Glp [Actinomycetota bacterium]|nr:gephyrin-like molybdotransferase Glp [Actinomycetota bacterium]